MSNAELFTLSGRPEMRAVIALKIDCGTGKKTPAAGMALSHRHAARGSTQVR